MFIVRFILNSKVLQLNISCYITTILCWHFKVLEVSTPTIQTCFFLTVKNVRKKTWYISSTKHYWVNKFNCNIHEALGVITEHLYLTTIQFFLNRDHPKPYISVRGFHQSFKNNHLKYMAPNIPVCTVSADYQRPMHRENNQRLHIASPNETSCPEQWYITSSIRNAKYSNERNYPIFKKHRLTFLFLFFFLPFLQHIFLSPLFYSVKS